MPPRRRATRRGTASPSPAPQARLSRASTPASGRAMPDRGGAVRTPIPAKYSTSYGSPMSQLPDRSSVAGGGNITKAAAEIFTKVTKDNLAAEARRRTKEQSRAARTRGSTASPQPPTVQPTIEEDGEEEEAAESSEEQSEEESSSGEEESMKENQNGPEAGLTKPPAATRLLQRPARKRAREDEEAETRAEKERTERDARLRRERSAEAQSRMNQKLAEAQAAERERLAQQEARDRAAKAEMPPPPQPPVPRHPSGLPLTPITLPGDTSMHRPPSARSFIEESAIFLDAQLRTPIPPSLRNAEPGPPPPPQPQPGSPQAARTRASVARPSEQVSPPSSSRRSPRRSTGTVPGPRSDLSSIPEHPQAAPRQPEQLPKPPDEERTRRPDQSAASGFASQLRSRPKHPFSQSSPEQKDEAQPAREVPDGGRPYWPNLKHPLSPSSILKLLGAAFIMLHSIRLLHTLVRPDLFETPVFSLSWYGWGDWTSNIGQLFPSPLLHPLGVLSHDQYYDLKDYLQARTTTLEAAVDNLRSIIPKVVSVKKDKSGRIVVADEFWDALKDRIKRDEGILSLDGKSRISEKHWKAVQERLKSAGLLEKPLSAADVERIVEKSAPTAWENWLQKNQRKVADLLGRKQGKGDEVVVTRQEFIRELSDQLAKSKKQIDSEMESLRQDLQGLLQEVKAAASAGGMSKAEIAALVKEAVVKEIGHRQLKAGTRTSVAHVDAELRRRVNHFGVGNGAMIDVTLTSPTWNGETSRPPVGSKKYLKSIAKQPQFQYEMIHALTAWIEAGHCWCAATLTRNGTLPADVAVRLANFVIPQYVVLEHIDPSATTDPLAMPKDVEVWAVFDEHGRQERVAGWMAASFPGDVGKNHPLVQKGFAKIGRFTYEHRPQDEGVYVHRLSADLERLGAATDMVLIRALTNYGAEDHTCFYRIRLYGEVVDLEAEKESRNW
ncbi:hypothetical protein VTK56DRAFT_3861 [Thermocarpiscus australiensis]